MALRPPATDTRPGLTAHGPVGILAVVAEKKRWKDFTPAQKTAIVVGGAGELVVTSIALRDLVRRPRAQVRGPKVLWLLGFFVQPIGAPTYLMLGRRRTGA